MPGQGQNSTERRGAKSRRALALACLAIVFVQSARAEDELFERMRGEWTGVGRRVFVASGRVVEIVVEVESLVQGGRLISSNRVVESGAGGVERRYERAYWIESDGSGREVYRLGAGDSLLAEGRLSGASFESVQRIGGFRVRSVTEWPDRGRAEHVEESWNGERLQSRATVSYRRRED